MRVFKVLGGALLAISFLVGCASSQATADHPGVEQQDSVEESKPDNEVYETFVGTDAQAMAALGQRVERDRPPLKPEVVAATGRLRGIASSDSVNFALSCNAETALDALSPLRRRAARES
jgi:hypothetical protein